MDDPAADDDGDGLDNAAELEAGTSPTNADTDGDGAIDPAGSYYVPNLPIDVALTVTVTMAWPSHLQELYR